MEDLTHKILIVLVCLLYLRRYRNPLTQIFILREQYCKYCCLFSIYRKLIMMIDDTNSNLKHLSFFKQHIPIQY